MSQTIDTSTGDVAHIESPVPDANTLRLSVEVSEGGQYARTPHENAVKTGSNDTHAKRTASRPSTDTTSKEDVPVQPPRSASPNTSTIILVSPGGPEESDPSPARTSDPNVSFACQSETVEGPQVSPSRRSSNASGNATDKGAVQHLDLTSVPSPVVPQLPDLVSHTSTQGACTGSNALDNGTVRPEAGGKTPCGSTTEGTLQLELEPQHPTPLDTKSEDGTHHGRATGLPDFQPVSNPDGVTTESRDQEGTRPVIDDPPSFMGPSDLRSSLHQFDGAQDPISNTPSVHHPTSDESPGARVRCAGNPISPQETPTIPETTGSTNWIDTSVANPPPGMVGSHPDPPPPYTPHASITSNSCCFKRCFSSLCVIM